MTSMPSLRWTKGAAALAAFLVPALGWPARARAGADLGFNMYGDVDYIVEKSDGQATNSFMAPRVEVFYTATHERLSFLAEVMTEVDDNEFHADVERVGVGFLFAEWLRVWVGRFHTAIGYYNDAYHHGRYFQMTTNRPQIVRFEDEGGLIPAHSVGLHLDGRLGMGAAGWLRYDADLANGRGAIAEEVTNLEDHNKGKAVNLRLRYEPALVEGLILGANLYLDSIDAAASDPLTMTPTTRHVGERILGAHLAYLEHNVQVIAEVLGIAHRSDIGTGITRTGFAEAGYTLRDFTPYLRLEVARFPAVLDPFYATNKLALRGSFKGVLAGVRYTASEYIALKLELGQDALDAGGTIRRGTVQCAFAF
jgi:hypothetical protein